LQKFNDLIVELTSHGMVIECIMQINSWLASERCSQPC